MKSFKFILTLSLLIFTLCLNGQNRVSGNVIDEVTKERLAFVNIVINETGTLGTTSDIDGNFNIISKNKINTLTFSFVGYEKKKIVIDDRNEISVKLRPQNIQLSEIIIDGSNNPANRIIDSVYKYRDSNNPQSLDSYYYKMYDNMVFTIDTSWIKDNKISNQLRKNDILAMETVSEQYFLKPNKSKKNILANKFSGSKNPVFIYIIESIQGIGFYDDLINIDTKKYVNPISKNSTNKYIFVLEDAFTDETHDSIFIISFRPYKNTNFNSLKGTLTINSDKWAIQNIKAAPTKQASTYNIEIQQLYEKVKDEFWFPKQLNTIVATYDRESIKTAKIAHSNDTVSAITISMNGQVNMPLLGIGKSYITDIEINKTIDKNIFDHVDFSIDENAANANDIIMSYRYDKLSNERLEATYQFVDSIFQDANINIDKITSSLNSLINNEIPIGYINLNLNDIMDYNIGNGYMLGLGLSTNNRLSNVISIGGFGNYWFKAKEPNYGGNMDFKISKSKDTKLRLSYSHKFERLGDFGFEESKSILSSDSYKLFYVNATSLNNTVSANLSSYLNRYLKGFIGFEVADKAVNIQQVYRLSTLDFKLRIAFGEKFIQSKEGLSVGNIANTVIWLSYQKNLKNVFGSPYNFDKAEFLFRGRKETKYWGESSLTAQLGYINGIAPITDLFNIFGINYGRWEIYSTEAFNTMRPDEFLCDRFAALYFSHNFKNLLIDFKKFHPELTIVTNIAWGDLNKSTTQQLNSIDKGYYESGIIIDNIINSGFSKLGLGMFYRYGPYSYDKTWDNFVFKICLGFSL